ncbi:MAG TPA: JAB domain-containing protein [Burkholderiaceae bacterium]|nr:JAB domain-containing protein [Burkholderiaceae bacterium]
MEAIVLGENFQPGPLQCSDATVQEYLDDTADERQARLRLAIAAAHELLTRIAADQLRGRKVISTPRDARQYLRIHCVGAERETFFVAFLDAAHRVVSVEELFLGTLTQTAVYPREIVKRALLLNAAAVLLAHQHPTGTMEPSNADRLLTDSIRGALRHVDVNVLDHFIFAPDGSSAYSFAEAGLI